MARIPHAANVLTAQVRDKLHRKPDSKAGAGTSKPSGEPDGLGVYRALEFDRTASKLLSAAKDTLTEDVRIEAVEEDKGVVTVHFSPRPIADNRTEFDLDVPASESDDG